MGRPWESQGHPDHDGFAWYRKHFSLGASLKQDPAFARYQALRVNLGAIDDVDEAWVNGHRIGGTGTFPPNYGTAWQTQRWYTIPARFLKWEGDNVLAVRVFDGTGPGGMAAGPHRLQVANWTDQVRVEFDLGRGDGVFDKSSKLPIVLRVTNQSTDALQTIARWSIEDDEGTSLHTSETPVKLSAQGEQQLLCEFQPTAPGFFRAQCEIRIEDDEHRKSVSMILGLRPQSIRVPLTRQPDFDEFWEETLVALEKIPPAYNVVAMPELDSPTHRAFEVTMRSLDNVRVAGWYQCPKAEGQHPVVLRVPGYTENMRPVPITDPIAIFSFNVRGHGNSQQDVSGKPEDYWIRGLDDKWGYFYQGAYADCIRAVDFLMSRKETDPRRIAVTGGSQGGGLSLVTAALDPRIAACAPDIPFLCDWVKYFKTTHWPEMDQWIAARESRSWESTLKTMSYFDALNFTDRIQCPVLLGLGLQDDVCPPATIFAVYNRLQTDKQYFVYPQDKHWVSPQHVVRKREWLQKLFFADN